MWRGRPAWAEIDLDAIEHNVAQIKKIVGDRVKVLAVVKANAYGHGAVPVAKTAIKAGVSQLGVFCVEEGIQLRRAGIKNPIIVLGYVPPWQTDQAATHNLTVTVNSLQTALALSARSNALGVQSNVHIKVDSGLGRGGLLPDEVLPFVRSIISLPNLRIEGLWTHFASADEKDKTYTRRQLAVYQDTLKALNNDGIEISCRHLANSAATMEMPETHFDMVRCGIAIYGLYPSDDVGNTIPLRPAMSLRSRIARVRVLPAGSSISYGRTFVTDRPTIIGLVPFGYADGFTRHLSNLGQVLVGGVRCPVVGRICMDQFAINLQHAPEVHLNDEVVIVGRQGTEELSVNELAAATGTINYEIVSNISDRVPRVYVKGHQVVGVTDLLSQYQ